MQATIIKPSGKLPAPPELLQKIRAQQAPSDPPPASVDHLDRIDECEAALKAEFQGLTEAALEAR
ncbi:hypothetical protein [Candidatus Phyllobacterium onerii]|uniref:hypothetical protein n=1 Tax=Candidatus Phyllobacterium onerii TaxID=3020828 RepID=UPI00232CEBBD|nr:hypothetical protein [Phyllobacterium sp. IY22]